MNDHFYLQVQRVPLILGAFPKVLCHLIFHWTLETQEVQLRNACQRAE